MVCSDNFLGFKAVLTLGFRVCRLVANFLGLLGFWLSGLGFAYGASGTHRVLGLKAIRALGRPPLYLMGCQEINLCVFCCCRYLVFSVCFFSSVFSSSPVCFFRGHFCCLSFFSLALALLLLLSCSCREFNLCAVFLVEMSFLNFIFSPNLSLVTRVVLAPLVPCSFCFFLWKCLF